MTAGRYPATIARRPMAAVFEARGSEAGLREGFRAAGLRLPETRNEALQADGGVHLMRIGPRRALALAFLEAEAALDSAFSRGFAKVAAADVANVSDMFAAFAVEGPGALDVLKQGAPLDLSPAAFPVGSATGTEMWSAALILIREAEDRYAILIDRSLAGYLEDWLTTANGLESGLRPGTMLNPPASLQPK